MLRPGERVDAYEVVRALGRGAAAVSYLARDPTGRLVVLKLPEGGSDDDPRRDERFRREVAIVRELHHPRVRAAIEPSDAEVPSYLVLEYGGGSSLRALLEGEDGRGRPEPEAALAIVRQVLEALAYIHDRGIVHRDIKPENIVVSPAGAVHIIDFGSAHRIASGDSSDARVDLDDMPGTPDYAAPELIAGGEVGPPVDVYAAGAVLYELLTGRPPFTGDSAAAVLYQQVHAPPPHPRMLQAAVSPQLDDVVVRALQKRPDRRYPSAGAMLAALDRTPEGRAVRKEALGDRGHALGFARRLRGGLFRS